MYGKTSKGMNMGDKQFSAMRHDSTLSPAAAPQAPVNSNEPHQRQRKQNANPQRKSSSFFGKFALVAGAAVVALAVLAGGIVSTGGASKTDTPTREQLATIQASWDAAMAAGGALLPAVAPAEKQNALDSMNLPPEQRAALEADMDAGRISLVWVTVWDNYAEDGDVVDLSSDGVSVRVPLLNATTRIALPRPAGGIINLQGVHDGGGGITLGVISGGAGEILAPPLVPGQIIGLPTR